MADNIKNMNLAITVDDGSRRVPIQNTSGEEIGAFTFHPTDLGIIQRYNDMVAQFDRITAPLEALGGDDAGVDITDGKYAAALGEAEERLYEAVDKLLASDGAANAFFGRMSPFSLVNGEFYCTQVLTVLGEYIGAQLDAETAKFSEKAKKYARKATKR